MRSAVYVVCCSFVVSSSLAWFAAAEEPAAPAPVTLENVQAPSANTPDEPLAPEFSLDNAAHFLDSAALDWTKSRQCFTCHTNYLYLMARPAISADVPAYRSVRAAAEALVTERWPQHGPRWDAEVVKTAGMLAASDAATTGKLHETTRAAFEKMWTLQREDGGFTWIKCEWPPMESDDHYGACFALVAVGLAPEGYAQTPAAQAGIARLKGYLASNPPPTLHHRAMLLWAASYLPELLSEEERQATMAELRKLQHEDGGWGLATLGDWPRGDGTPQDVSASDGYGTGFVLYVLRRGGVPADDGQVQRGVAWLKGHQRASGRWFTRSLFRDSKHFITHAGTAMAVMALAECEPRPAAEEQAAR